MSGSTSVMALPYPTATDLVQNVHLAIKALADAVDANLPRGALVAQTLAADVAGIGAATLFTINITPGAGRVLRFTVSLDFALGTAFTGVSIVVKRGGVQVGKSHAAVHTSSAFMETQTVVIHDTATTAGALVYTVEAAGYGANGQTVKAGTRVLVDDLGPL